MKIDVLLALVAGTFLTWATWTTVKEEIVKRRWSLPRRRPQESYQEAVKYLCEERGYTMDPVSLALYLCEEVGEVAHEVLNLSTLFESGSERTEGDIEHELFDVLSCLCALASSVGVDLGI